VEARGEQIGGERERRTSFGVHLDQAITRALHRMQRLAADLECDRRCDSFVVGL
jgi:hypothetical protein